MKKNTILNVDCLSAEGLRMIPDETIDLILCDLPYEKTQNKWDVLLPLDLLWKEYERVIKPHGAIVLTASQPFTSLLVMSNPKLFAALSSTQDSMNSYNPISTEAINATDAVNTKQVTDAGDATNYARYKAMLDQYVNAGLNKDAIVRSLGMAGADNSMIFKILSDNGM